MDWQDERMYCWSKTKLPPSLVPIVAINSKSGKKGSYKNSAYAASKWAQVGLTKTWAMELGPEGIRVNAISPGSVEGPRIDAVIEREAVKGSMIERQVREHGRQACFLNFKRFNGGGDNRAVMYFHNG